MKTYLLLVREPDGRTNTPTAHDTQRHQLAWQQWIRQLVANGHWLDGNSLTLTGCVLRPTTDDYQRTDGPYRVNGLEIVGGYMRIKATDLNEAVALMQSCPVFEADGSVEIREIA